MTWLSTTEFALYTGITASSDVVVNALSFAEKDIIRHIFISDIYKASSQTSMHQIYTPLMDVDGDSTITSSDLSVYQEDEKGRRTYVTTSITDVDSYSGIVTFDCDYPTSSDYSAIVIESYRGRELFGKMLTELKELEKLKATNIIYQDIIAKKLSKGYSSWNLNGVNVALDDSAMHKVVEENNKKVSKLYMQLRPKRFDGIKPGYKTHDTDILTDYGVRFQ